jgi:hypothetical protein
MKSYIAIFVFTMAASAVAQQPPSPAQEVSQPQVPSRKTPPPSATAPCLPGSANCNPSEGGQPVNIRVDVSLIEHTDKGPGQPQTVSVILADRALGQTRAAFADRTLLVDARPTIVGELVRINITIKSEEPPRTLIPGAMPNGPDRFLNWTNSFAVLLPSGKPMTALETSDPVTKRKMSIEVKTTVQK